MGDGLVLALDDLLKVGDGLHGDGPSLEKPNDKDRALRCSFAGLKKPPFRDGRREEGAVEGAESLVGDWGMISG